MKGDTVGVGRRLPVGVLHAELGEDIFDVVQLRDVQRGIRVTHDGQFKVAMRCAEAPDSIICSELSDEGVDKAYLGGVHCEVVHADGQADGSS